MPPGLVRSFHRWTKRSCLEVSVCQRTKSALPEGKVNSDKRRNPKNKIVIIAVYKKLMLHVLSSLSPLHRSNQIRNN